MRIIFAGTPAFAAETLKALINTEHEICAVYTQPDRPAGRGRKLTASPVKQLALEHNIPVEQPLNFKTDDAIQTLAGYQADLMIVVAYGLLLPQVVLDTPKLGCINVHASLLPRWRGAAPIQRAILAGDKESGVCIMQMEAGLDTGPVLSEARCPITEEDTAQVLHDRLAILGATTLVETLKDIEQRQRNAKPQNDDLTSYASKLDKKEADIDWQLSAQDILRKINAFNPWPVAQTIWHDAIFRIWRAQLVKEETRQPAGQIIKVDKVGIDVATGDGVIRITELQLPGKRAMSVQDFLNANTMKVGDHFG
ncbi:methionyl-tRNA formyltransferase [Methylophaga thalassica]|uniref:Methionyl-tRNA formyltransferase n=1 Tax=Methylophaga aminisulfidivorans MP TaxID=1026882 RepID=F5SYY5_9GAMM|nr:methionyl-tRNA formyltransferase [Methylophaga aminisulfidivorans]EGL54306.1 methionyl-tRNA formyltransferase [Methylophaga aminisulfidivorans MP]